METRKLNGGRKLESLREREIYIIYKGDENGRTREKDGIIHQIEDADITKASEAVHVRFSPRT